jgi:ABC-type multidrug transport system fused ATPase/permease subunit
MNPARSYLSVLAARPGPLVVGLLLAIAQSLLLIPIPIVVRRAFDHSIPTKNRSELLLLAAAIVLLSAGSGLLAILSQQLVQRTTKRATEGLRRRVVQEVFVVDLPLMDTLDPEDVHERLIGDPVRVESAANMILRQALPAAGLFIGLVGLLLSIDPFLTLAAATSAPILMVVNRCLRPSLQKSMEETQRAFEKLGSFSLTLVRSQMLLRGRGIDADAHAKICEQIVSLREQSSGRSHRLMTRAAIQATGLSLATAATLIFGGDAVMSDRITLGSLLSFFAAVALLRSPSTTLASMGPTLLEGRLSLARLERFLNAPRRNRAEDLGTEVVERVNEVELRGASYSYPVGHDGEVEKQHGPTAVEGLNLHIRPGRVLALSGPNGAGKTTILTLLLGLIRPTSGSILANGIELSALNGTQFRRGVGVLFQHAQFLPGTLLENLTAGRPNATLHDVELALGESEATSIVARLPHGLQTEIGEDFDRLSGGERQRLALARALVGRPGFLVFDEPSNHLPTGVVVRVIERVRSWPQPPALLLISHDRPLLSVADDHHVLLASGTVPEGKIA